ncbi:hypothetical protein [Luteibacter sp. 329MFSha]|uniref:hypothetical protein n=1 Tax=Luteibacter sp. 329MFSha TaxID=1798239 RepID=UPI0008BE7210|nr:hypothetical protein [Luteibacter sp. 329MFSha]SEW29574.1 hypothetical protein SAMN04515660_3708 [Luteibacter sp. 329MFSha]
MRHPTFTTRSLGNTLLLVLATVATSDASAGTTAKATYDGKDTVIYIHWEPAEARRPGDPPPPGYDGDVPAEFRSCSKQALVGEAADSLKYYFDDSNSYIDSRPQQLLTTIRPWTTGCTGDAFFRGVTSLNGNPFKVVIPNRNVIGQSLCYGGRNVFGDAGKFVDGTCTKVESDSQP